MYKSEKSSGNLGDCYTNAFILLSEECGHENVDHGPHPQPVARPRHHQAGHREGGAEAGLEEAEAQAEHGHGDEAEEDNVDILAV